MIEQYDSKQIEEKWRKIWLHNDVYKWDETKNREDNFSIDTPPPTVSGQLHLGHMFSYTQTDFIARFQRMRGKNVFYPMGFDDNGLPTERLVEKQKQIRAAQMPRQDFIDLCESVIKHEEQQFKNLFQDIGLSIDWSLQYQTIDARSRKISQMSFIDLYKYGKAKRTYAPTFWDWIDKTAIATAEIEDKEKSGNMYNIAFTTSYGQEIVIATTRPEMISGCVAVFYHPNDSRYSSLAGTAITPIFNKSVPILSDEDVDPDKGTGLVMCCTFGDIQDIQWWRTHKLDTCDIISLDGRMQNSGKYDGMKIHQAKEAIVKDLQNMSLIPSQTKVTQFVKCAERSGAILEIIPTHQWYVSLLDHKEKFLSRANECNWHPTYMRVRIENWINGLNQDWCISRQRYFGVPFPIWYSKRVGEEGKILVASVDQLPVDPLVDLPMGYTRDEVEADKDVMDTWATSSVTPQLTSHAINENMAIDYNRHVRVYPFDLRPQAHEIIRTWAFSTIVKSHFHQNTIPWKNLMINGWCLATDRSKMSKSKGNTINPKNLITDNGADVVRYWSSTFKLGVDTAFSDEQFKIGRKLINKLWNAAKFASLHFGKINVQPSTVVIDIENKTIFETLDLWILSRLQKTIEVATDEFKKFEYAGAKQAVEVFFWNDFCDNYLELVKKRVYNEGTSNDIGQTSAIHTIYYCLKNILLLFAPILPYITEELNSQIFGGNSIHTKGSWPKIEEHYFSEGANDQGRAAVEILELVRKFKSMQNISIKVPLSDLQYSGMQLNHGIELDLKYAANTNTIKYKQVIDTTIESEDKRYAIHANIA